MTGKEPTLSERLRARAKSENADGDEAAVERAMMGMEERADVWAECVDLNSIISNLVHVNRLSPKAPIEVREKFIKRQAEQFDALLRQSFLEGFLEGGLTRKAYDRDLDGASSDLIDSQAARIAELDGECAQSMQEIAALRSELDSQAQLLAEAKEVVSLADTQLSMAAGALLGISSDASSLERWWPARKRGSNANRIFSSILSRADAVGECVRDARVFLSKLEVE